MRKFSGKVACEGVAIGKILEIKKIERVTEKKYVQDVQGEVQRFFTARDKAVKVLSDLYEKTLGEMGDQEAAIFKAHRLMIEDVDYTDAVVDIIESANANAEYAVYVINDKYKKEFEMIADPYLKERIEDLNDVSGVIIDILAERKDIKSELMYPCIVLADNLTPGETVQMDRSNIIAFVMRKGSVHSHTAILARTMAIPSLVNVPVCENLTGKHAIVNTFDKTFIVEPDDTHVMRADYLLRAQEKKNAILRNFIKKEVRTKDGKKIEICANVSGVDDIERALENGAEGIGLFRSEFLYLDKENLPDEQMQYEEFKKAIEMMDGKKFVVRTPDIGDDKQLDQFANYKEANPALGYRGARLFFKREDLFKTHLRAVARAAVYGDVRVMLPMICSLWEVTYTKELMEEVYEELKAQKVPFKKVPLGIMVETPAAVMLAEELAKEVEFFSIGTNDLTQYTLAADRQNEHVESFYNPHHPAVLRMVELATKAALKNNVFVGVCGDLASDAKAINELINYGVQQLSVAPASILAVKKNVCEI